MSETPVVCLALPTLFDAVVARFDTDKQAQDSLAQELRKWAAVKMAFIDDFDSKQRHVYGPLGKFEWTVPLSTVGEHLL